MKQKLILLTTLLFSLSAGAAIAEETETKEQEGFQIGQLN